MWRPCCNVRMLAALLAMANADAVFCQSYPTRPVRIVTSAVGGASDLIARMVAQGISSPLGVPVIVDNRAVVSVDIVDKAFPDGYTLLFIGSSFWLLPLM